MEWCADWYDKEYYRTAPPGSSRAGAGSFRVIRGGSFNHMPRYCRAAYRVRYVPAYRDVNLGFRVVRCGRLSAWSLVL